MYYLCYKPDEKPDPGVVAHIYHAKVPRCKHSTKYMFFG